MGPHQARRLERLNWAKVSRPRTGLGRGVRSVPLRTGNALPIGRYGSGRGPAVRLKPTAGSAPGADEPS